MPDEYTENLDKLRKIFDEISEMDLKTTKSYQEFLLKLHTAIKHQYVNFSKTRKTAEDNWKSLKEQLSLWEKTFEKVLLEKQETAGQIESMRTLLDEKIYALTTKEDELETLLAENKSKEEEIEQLRNDVDELKKQIEDLKLTGVGSRDVDEIEKMISTDTEEDEKNKLQIVYLEENLNRVEKEKEELKQKYDELINSHNSLQEELERTQKELAEILQQKDKKIELIQVELEEKQRENLQLKTLLEQSNPEEQVKSLNEELEKNRETISELEKRLANSIAKSEYEQIKQELEKIQSEFKLLENKYQDMQEKWNAETQLIKEKELQIGELNQKLNNAPRREELESLKRQLEEKNAEINTLKEIK
ncbi:MAG: hypothetical protein ACP5KS_05650, partial [Candidatus Hydrogenedens sp.]